MARGRKTGGKNFVKGQSGNPDGRPTLPPEVKAARQMNGPMFELLINKYMGLPVDQLQVIAKDQSTPAIDLVVIKLLVMSIQHGDINRLKLLLEYTIGKVPDKLNVNAEVTNKTLYQQVLEEIENGNK